MSFCNRSNIVKIAIFVLILLLAIAGVIWYLKSSEDNSDDALEVFPQLDEGSLIRFKPSDGRSVWNVTKVIDEALKPYNSSESYIDHECSFNQAPSKDKTCGFDLKSLDPCTRANAYGYRIGKPCVFLKLAHNQDLVPEFYDPNDLPESMPQDLKYAIKSYVETSVKNSQIIWVSCEGKTPDDEKNIGPINYFPRRGFLGFYFPCLREDNCTEPLVALLFEKLTRQVEINIQCTIWAKNLHDTVDFKLFVE